MGANPQYAATAINGSQLLGSAETSLTAPTTTSTLITAGTSGTKIEAVQVTAIATTVAGLVYFFLYDGSTSHLFDMITVPAQTASTSLIPFTSYKAYDNLIIQSGWSLRASQSIAGNASLLKVHAFGGSF
jgi:hypothetical protein